MVWKVGQLGQLTQMNGANRQCVPLSLCKPRLRLLGEKKGATHRLDCDLMGYPDIISFVKNSQSTQFRMEYRNADGSIANYYPDFLVKRTDSEIWVIESKGREDLDDPPKWERLQQWCADATTHDWKRDFKPLFVRQEDFEKYQPKDFAGLCAMAE
jgi:hypothetical protein